MIGNLWRRLKVNRELSFETTAAFTLLAVILISGAGFFAATGLSGLLSSPPADTEGAGWRVETQTVKSVVTLRGGTRTVVQTVRIARPGKRPKPSGVLGTAVKLVTITTPGQTQRKIVPIVQRKLVTLPGKVKTVVETSRGRTRTNVVTSERVVTHERVVTSERVVTNNRTVTNVQTEQVTVPVAVTTVRTVTDTVPVTQTVTTTATITATVTLPPVTVTVTCPPKGCG